MINKAAMVLFNTNARKILFLAMRVQELPEKLHETFPRVSREELFVSSIIIGLITTIAFIVIGLIPTLIGIT
jgi:hypothetical protein